MQAGRHQPSVPPSPCPPRGRQNKNTASQDTEQAPVAGVPQRGGRQRRRASSNSPADPTSSDSSRDAPARGGGGRSIRTPVETQEVLLFHVLSLLHSMALDSARVRMVLGKV